MRLRAETTAEIRGTTNRWSLESDDPHSPRTRTAVSLEIFGSRMDGFHLIMSPEGFLAADNCYPTLEDALQAGVDLFGVLRKDWLETNAGSQQKY